MLHRVSEHCWVRQSEFCQSNTVVVQGEGGALLVDPGVTGDELAGLVSDLREAGITPTRAFCTHPHWDHMLWTTGLGEIPRLATGRAVAHANTSLDDARDKAGRLAPGNDLALIVPRGEALAGLLAGVVEGGVGVGHRWSVARRGISPSPVVHGVWWRVHAIVGVIPASRRSLTRPASSSPVTPGLEAPPPCSAPDNDGVRLAELALAATSSARRPGWRHGILLLVVKILEASIQGSGRPADGLVIDGVGEFCTVGVASSATHDEGHAGEGERRRTDRPERDAGHGASADICPPSRVRGGA